MTLTAFHPSPAPAGLDRHRPDLTASLSLIATVAALRAICAATRTATGGRPLKDPISQSTAHALVSTLNAAARVSTVNTDDMRPALPDLARHASDAARAADVKNPSEAATVESVDRMAVAYRARRLGAPPSTDPLVSALTRFGKRRKRKKGLPLSRRDCRAWSRTCDGLTAGNECRVRGGLGSATRCTTVHSPGGTPRTPVAFKLLSWHTLAPDGNSGGVVPVVSGIASLVGKRFGTVDLLVIRQRGARGVR